MSSASANSSTKTSKKEVENLGFKISGGYIVVGKEAEQYKILISEEKTIDNSVPMNVAVEKTVGTYTKKVDSKGRIVRTDKKTGTRYITTEDGKTKIVRAKDRETR